MNLDTIQAAIDLAWQYTDDPDECAVLSAANQAIEELRAIQTRCAAVSASRALIFDTEAATGYLDADAIHGTEDDACDIVAELAQNVA